MAKLTDYHYQTDGDKSNPALLFLHGFMGSSADWEGLVPFFSSERYCISIDLPGHGKTKVKSEEDFRMESCAGDIVAVLDSLSVDRADLVGYSMGGRLALYLAVNYPQKFGKIVIESASPGLKTETERLPRIDKDQELGEKIKTTPMTQFLEDWYGQPLFSTMDKSNPAFQQLINRRLDNDPNGLALSLKMMGIGAQPSLWSDLNKITVRLLLIVGEYDSKFRDIASEMIGLCPAASAVVVSGAGHNVHFENTKEYLNQVRLFLEK